MAAAGWIPEEHVRYFAKTLAMFAGSEFDDDDWVGLDHALFRSDTPGERSITWPFGSVDARFSYEPGDSVVVISVEASPDLEARVDTLIFVLQDVLTLDDDAQPVSRRLDHASRW